MGDGKGEGKELEEDGEDEMNWQRDKERRGGLSEALLAFVSVPGRLLLCGSGRVCGLTAHRGTA